MRGRRAFVVLTIYLLLLGAFAWMVELFLERSFAMSFGGFTYASAEIGRGIFGALLIFETLLVVLLAPAFTAGAISLEREKQTLDLLTGHADQLARHRHRQALLGPHLRLPAHRCIGPADRPRVRLRGSRS